MTDPKHLYRSLFVTTLIHGRCGSVAEVYARIELETGLSRDEIQDRMWGRLSHPGNLEHVPGRQDSSKKRL